jgi:hypothetical protein
MTNEIGERDGRRGDVARRLAPLSDLPKYHVIDGDPDVRGWDVESADGEKIGEVHDLIVDTVAMKVRYLDIDIDNAVLGTEADHHILVPVGCATLNREDNEVHLTEVTVVSLANVPAYTHEPIKRSFERLLRRFYPAEVAAGIAPDAPGRGREEDFYDHDHFDEDRFFGRERSAANRTPYIARCAEDSAAAGGVSRGLREG